MPTMCICCRQEVQLTPRQFSQRSFDWLRRGRLSSKHRRGQGYRKPKVVEYHCLSRIMREINGPFGWFWSSLPRRHAVAARVSCRKLGRLTSDLDFRQSPKHFRKLSVFSHSQLHHRNTMPSRSPTSRRDAASRSPYSRASRSPSRTPRRSISPRPSPSPQRRSRSRTRTRSPAHSRSRSRSYRARSTSRGRDRSPTPPMPRSSKVS